MLNKKILHISTLGIGFPDCPGIRRIFVGRNNSSLVGCVGLIVDSQVLGTVERLGGGIQDLEGTVVQYRRNEGPLR